MSELSVVVSRRFSASIARVFEAWLDPEALAKFMTPCVGGPTSRVTNNPVEGGEFEIIMRTEEKEIPHRGFYKTIDRYRKLVFTWESPFSLPDSEVTLDFVERGGETEVTLTHVKFVSEEARKGHEGGWTSIMTALDPVLAQSKAA